MGLLAGQHALIGVLPGLLFRLFAGGYVSIGDVVPVAGRGILDRGESVARHRGFCLSIQCGFPAGGGMASTLLAMDRHYCGRNLKGLKGKSLLLRADKQDDSG